MRLNEATIDDLQRLRLVYSVKVMAQLFSVQKDEMYRVLREWKIESPTEYLRIRRKELALLILSYGHEKVASRYNVSVTFLRGLYVRESGDGKVAALDIIQERTEQFLVSEIKRWASPTIISRMFGVTKSRLPAVLIKDKFAHQGNLASAIGRKAELFVLDRLGGKDMNLEDPRSVYDIHHKVYGRINVKATKKRTWRAPKVENCDYCALIVYKKNSYIFGVMIPADLCPMTISQQGHGYEKGVVVFWNDGGLTL